MPCERPLSKSFLAGKDSEESVLINPPDFYSAHDINVRRNSTVEYIDTEHNRLNTVSGEHFAFETLVLATGAPVRTLDVPGASSENVFYLRSLLGARFIAMEVGAVLASRGIETSMIVRDVRIWKAVFTREMTVFLGKYYSERGVRLITQTAIARLKMVRWRA